MSGAGPAASSGNTGSAVAPVRPADPRPVRKRRRWWVAGVVVAVAVVVVAGILVYEIEQVPVTHVRTILLASLDNVCGISDQRLGVAGYNSTGTAATSVVFALPNVNETSCTVGEVTTNTSGFSVGGISVPFSIAAHGHLTLTVRVTPPARSFTGDLTLLFE